MNAYRVTPDPLWASERYRRAFAWSAGTHVIVLLIAALGPAMWTTRGAPSAIFVEVVAASAPPPPQAAAKKQVVDEAVVIPKRLKKLEPKPVPPKKVEKKPEPPGPSAEELLKQMRQRHASASVLDDIRARQTARPGGAGRVNPQLARYKKEIMGCFYRNWTVVRDLASRSDLEVRFDVDIGVSGRVRRVALRSGSGNRYLDESAERAIWRCDPLSPPPPGGRQLFLIFNPAEVR